MPYIAMARKWRPHSFSEMVGQEHIAQTLKNAITTGNIHHAFLFSGTRGVGKTTSARILAAMLNCTAASEQKPCGQCESCKAITAGLSMDVMEMDAASNNGVDDMREVLSGTEYPPMNSKYRVLIIDEVHALSKPAWYSMLKTLEEPPSYLVFIFATTDPNKIPATILSRVLCFDFKRLSSLQISKRLAFICEQENIKVAPEALSIISEKADGSMRDALTIFDEVFAYSGNFITAESAQKALGIPPDALYVELIKAFEAHDAKGSFAVLEKATLAGAEIQVFLDGFIRFLRNFLYARLGISAEQLEISSESLDNLKKLAPEFDQGDILRISKIIMELSEKCSAKHGLNPRLIAEAEFSKIAWLDRVVNINEALKNISSVPNVPLNKENQKKSVVLPAPAALVLPPVPVAPVPPPAPSGSIFEKDLKENFYFADFVKYMELKLVGIKPIGIKEKQNIKENQNGYAADDAFNAENANSNEENSGEFAEPEL